MYFEDSKDIALLHLTVAAAKNTAKKMANVGELNKQALFVNADEAFSKGGKSFKKRVDLSRNLLGFSGADSITFEKERAAAHDCECNRPMQGWVISQISGVIKNKDGQPVAGALVRLKALALQDSSTAIRSAGRSEKYHSIQERR